MAATGFVAWLLWPSAEPAPQGLPLPLPLGVPTADGSPAVVIPAPGTGGGVVPAPAPMAAPQPAATAQPTAAPPPVTAPTAVPTAAPPTVGNEERELPKSDLISLRQVAAWSGESLELTVYNGTAYRVTEIYVTIQRFVGDEMIDDETPILLLPPQANVDAGVATLLNKVAPDRAKPGVNPFDTGQFAGIAGPRPDAYRCQIVSARGQPLR